MNAKLMVLAALLLLFQGCDQLVDSTKNPPTAAKANPKEQPKAPKSPIHRFVLTRDGGVAFDTQTGRICRTWDWQLIAKQPKPDSEGNIPQRTFGELAPTCIS
jgi:hypothetical protein